MQLRPRLLCLLSSPDAPEQYIPVMNAIFAAQVQASTRVGHCAQVSSGWRSMLQSQKDVNQ